MVVWLIDSSDTKMFCHLPLWVAVQKVMSLLNDKLLRVTKIPFKYFERSWIEKYHSFQYFQQLFKLTSKCIYCQKTKIFKRTLRLKFLVNSGNLVGLTSNVTIFTGDKLRLSSSSFSASAIAKVGVYVIRNELTSRPWFKSYMNISISSTLNQKLKLLMNKIQWWVVMVKITQKSCGVLFPLWSLVCIFWLTMRYIAY